MPERGMGRRPPSATVATAMLAILASLTIALGVTGAPQRAGAQASCFGAAPTRQAVVGRVTFGTAGDDVILGTAGDDVVHGLGGNDRICTGGGTDRVFGGSGRDRVDLGSGDDVASGGAGPDQLLGGTGRDVVLGRAGADQLVGGPGLDACLGGSGSDTPRSCRRLDRSGRFETLPPGAALPSEAECALRVRRRPEVRAGNATYNATRGSNPHDDKPDVTGDFTGTTDEIIQWAACKHGVDADLARAQMAIESWWHQTARGDRTTDPSLCHPVLRRAGARRCPESIGLGQVRYQYHLGAYEDTNAIRSTAYNVDYTYSYWRDCYDGEFGWLNSVERGRTYAAGDALGCMGVWFSGRWYTAPGIEYMRGVRKHVRNRVWETPEFLAG